MEAVPPASTTPQDWMKDVIAQAVAEASEPSVAADVASEETAVEYLVIWRGYPAEENTWEPADNILDAALIADFERREAALDAMPAEVCRSPTPPRRAP